MDDNWLKNWPWPSDFDDWDCEEPVGQPGDFEKMLNSLRDIKLSHLGFDALVDLHNLDFLGWQNRILTKQQEIDLELDLTFHNDYYLEQYLQNLSNKVGNVSSLSRLELHFWPYHLNGEKFNYSTYQFFSNPQILNLY
jgi:hypothetical protein